MPQVVMAVAAVVGAGAAVYGTVKSVKAQKQAAQLQQQQQMLATRQSNRAAMREAQLRRAQTLSSAQALGAVGGSAVSGGISSLGSQLGGSFGFSSQMSGLSKEIGMAQGRATNANAISSIGGSIFQAAGGFDAFKKKDPNVDLLKGV